MITQSKAWLRGARAIHEITGIVDPYELRRAFNRELERILGPAIGMTVLERWENHTTAYEMEIFVEALEERSAIVFDGPKAIPKPVEIADV